MRHAAEAGTRQLSFSVVMPFRNAASYLPRVLGSLRLAKRNFAGDVEVIFVDNESSDGSVRIIRECWGRDARILAAPDACVGAVRNRGASVSRAALLAFIDADCQVSPEYF